MGAYESLLARESAVYSDGLIEAEIDGRPSGDDEVVSVLFLLAIACGC